VTTNILQTIMDERRAAVERSREEVPIERLREMAAGRVHHSLRDRLESGEGVRIIAEVKKASPSAGLLREDYRPGAMARVYEEEGAVGVSVLTEPRHFLGSEAHLRAVRLAVDLPVLRKDFMCDAYQIVEAAAWGADVVLLIVAALERRTLHALNDEALLWGLEVLVEAHTAEEISTALGLDQAVLGVNSRNLRTLRTSLSVAHSLAQTIPRQRLCVAESGIHSFADVCKLQQEGYDGFLIGEALLADPDPAAKMRRLRGVS